MNSPVRSLFQFLLIFLATSACRTFIDREDAWDIKGNWYTFAYDPGSGIYDSLLNYTEYYINDSIREVQEELAGQHAPQQYFIKGDSIYLGFGTDNECEFDAIYRINKLERDTIWLTIDPRWTKGPLETYWIRFPKDEKGQFDYDYNSPIADSLRWSVVFDWYRRRDKHFAMRRRNMGTYDSLVNAGRYDWNMSSPMIQESIERRKTRRSR